MSLNLTKSKEGRDGHCNSHKATRVSSGKHYAQVSLSSYRNRDLEQTAEELGSIWGYVKADPPVYQQ